MPGLLEVEVCVHRRNYHVLLRLEDPDWEGAWPPGGHTAQNNGSSTVQKLTLELQFSKINFAPLCTLFSNVSILHLNLPWAIAIVPRNIPVAEICKYFPQLAELKIKGEDPSLDADFCGILEEEVELMREETEDYLKLVHIVPIRPYVSLPCQVIGIVTVLYVHLNLKENFIRSSWHGTI